MLDVATGTQHSLDTFVGTLMIRYGVLVPLLLCPPPAAA